MPDVAGFSTTSKDAVAHSIEAHNRDFVPKPPTFSSKLEEREFLKFRLAQAFRIFGGVFSPPLSIEHC